MNSVEVHIKIRGFIALRMSLHKLPPTSYHKNTLIKVEEYRAKVGLKSTPRKRMNTTSQAFYLNAIICNQGAGAEYIHKAAITSEYTVYTVLATRYTISSPP